MPLDELSLLQLVWWLARPGGVLPAVRDTRAYVGAHGTSTLIARLHDQLDSAVHLGCPASAVTVESGDRVVVAGGGEHCWPANRPGTDRRTRRGFRIPVDALDAATVIDWADQPYVGGTYVAYRPGQVTAHAPSLDHGTGPVWFASAERSTWPDSMEGAVESGERAAGLAIAQINED